MKAIELLKIGGEMLKMMSKNGIKVDDVRFIGMYNDYLSMREKGEKYNYCIMTLAEKYGVSERTVSRVVSRFARECHGVTS